MGWITDLPGASSSAEQADLNDSDYPVCYPSGSGVCADNGVGELHIAGDKLRQLHSLHDRRLRVDPRSESAGDDVGSEGLPARNLGSLL